MKPLTKIVVSRRSGGIAAQLVPVGKESGVARGRRGRTPSLPAAPVTLTSGPEKPKLKKPRVAKPRYQRWREANPELYLERQREYQKRYKARKQAEKTKK